MGIFRFDLKQYQTTADMMSARCAGRRADVLDRIDDIEGLDANYRLLRRTLDLLPDGVLIIGSNREVLYLNEAFERLWRIPPQMVQAGDEAMLGYVLEQLDDPQTFIELVERLYGSSEPSDDELTFKDGRVFSRRSVALEAGDGGFSRIWIFSDVTEARSARIDPLTRLLNRRTYGRELPDFMAAAQPDILKAFALAVLDQFKAYNDRYGHAAGDTVLERIGEIMRDIVASETGKAFRIGGEEFAIASMHCDERAAISFHQSILRGVRQAGIAHAGNDPHGVVTLSMGLGLFSGAADPKEVFASVDRALYRAKKLGRDNIAMASSERAGRSSTAGASLNDLDRNEPRQVRKVDLNRSLTS